MSVTLVVQARTNGLAAGSLVPGTLAFLCIPIIPSLIAIILGHLSLARITRTESRNQPGTGIDCSRGRRKNSWPHILFADSHVEHSLYESFLDAARRHGTVNAPDLPRKFQTSPPAGGHEHE